MAERKKTTMYLDAEVLRAAKVAAAREDKPEYVIVEEALRGHLGFDLLERIWARSTLTEDEATDLAVSEVRAYRRAGRRKDEGRARTQQARRGKSAS